MHIFARLVLQTEQLQVNDVNILRYMAECSALRCDHPYESAFHSRGRKLYRLLNV